MAKITPAGKAIVWLLLLGGAMGAYWFAVKPRMDANKAVEAQSGPVVGGETVVSPGDGVGFATQGAGVGVSQPRRQQPVGQGRNYDPNRTYKVAISAWPGHMGGVIGNGGLRTATGSVAARLGLDLEIQFIEEPTPKNTALQTGAVDFTWQVVDELPLNMPGYRAAGVEPKAFVQIDWSRGGDACIASKEIKKPEDVVGHKSAMMQFSPDHTVFEFMLQNSRLTPQQVAQVRADTSFSLDDFTYGRVMFVQGKADVACLWEPDVTLALKGRAGAHRLFSTADATNLVADVLLADSRLLAQVPDVAMKVAQVFMEGADLAVANKPFAAKLVSDVVPRFRDELGYDGTLKSFEWIRWTNLGDNAKFFGLDGAQGGGIEFDRVYAQADGVWSQYPDAKIEERFVPARLRDGSIIQSLYGAARAVGKAPEAEVVHYDPKVAQKGEAALAKPVAIHFATNAAGLTAETMFLLRSQVLSQLGLAEGMSIRVEGNTDSVGDPGYNRKLSERRAAAVRDFLVAQGQFPTDRIAAKGNGSDAPVATNATEDGRAQNRRTDILFVRGQGVAAAFGGAL